VATQAVLTAEGAERGEADFTALETRLRQLLREAAKPEREPLRRATARELAGAFEAAYAMSEGDERDRADLFVLLAALYTGEEDRDGPRLRRVVAALERAWGEVRRP